MTLFCWGPQATRCQSMGSGGGKRCHPCFGGEISISIGDVQVTIKMVFSQKKKKSGETPDLSSILMIFMDWMSLLLGIQLLGVRACLARVKSVEAITGTSTHYSCRRAHRCPSPVLVIPTGVKWYAWYARCLWLISILVGEIRIYIRCDGLKWSQMFIIVHHSFVWDIQSTNRFVS